MPAIPTYEVIHTVRACQGDVEGIGIRLLWKCRRSHDLGRQIDGLLRDMQDRQAFDDRKSSCCRDGITGCSFLEDQVRNIERVTRAPLPPGRCDRLVRQLNNVTASPADEIADNLVSTYTFCFMRRSRSAGYVVPTHGTSRMGCR